LDSGWAVVQERSTVKKAFTSMTSDLLDAPARAERNDTVQPRSPSPRRRLWILPAGLLIITGTGLGLLVHDVKQTNARFDRTHQILNTTVARLQLERSDQAALQKDVNALESQATDASSSLSQETSQLQSVLASLAHVQTDVSQQGSSIVGLQDCLGGVEQALNALSVGDQRSAITALDAVTTSCESAVAASG
jgi:hypothetical protein